ncbi:hypothetical protein N2152v2_008766 [Parachlorella kessleri]
METRKAQLDELVAKLSKMFPEVKNLTANELHALLEDPDQEVVLVDVRLPEEVAVSVIPGKTLTEEEFQQQKEELRDSKVVSYCTVGFRSSQFVKRAQAEGFQAYNLAGSIVAWTQEGYPLVVRPQPLAGSQAQRELEVEHQPGQPTKRVHVFGKQWALQGEGYEPVMFGSPYWEYAKGAVRKLLPSWLHGGN